MKIAFHPYSLTPVTSLNAASSASIRQGVLLRVDWGKDLVGYADLHPWPELGDLHLQEQLEDFRNGRMSPQVERSVWFAQRDAEARAAGKSLFASGTRVINNFLLSNPVAATPEFIEKLKLDGFAIVKVKCGSNAANEIKAVTDLAKAGFRLRLDFNALGSSHSFSEFMKALSEDVRKQIEYVEDPFGFDFHEWMEAKKWAPVALDNQYSLVPWGSLKQVPFDVIVVKPAKMDIDRVLRQCQQWNLKLAMTSYMDHPVGASHSLALAMELQKNYPQIMLEAGCMTHQLYRPDDFSREMGIQGPFVIPAKGLGIGFDDLLGKIPWQDL